MVRYALGVVFIVLAATGGDDAWVVRLNGTGPVRVGMTLPELNRTLHTSISRPTDPDERACFYVDVPNQSGMGLMILNGSVARVDVDNKTTRTAEGVQNGDLEEHALQVYGSKLKVEPHHYLPENGHYLTLLSTDRKYGIRFETEDGKITRYYAGTVKAISYIEGCS